MQKVWAGVMIQILQQLTADEANVLFAEVLVKMMAIRVCTHFFETFKTDSFKYFFRLILCLHLFTPDECQLT